MSRRTTSSHRRLLLVPLTLAALTGGLCPAGADASPATVTASATVTTPTVVTSPSSGSASTTPLPTQAEWLADVTRAMSGSRVYLRERAAASAAGSRLAVNLDIDNTSLESHYDWGAPVPVVLRFARFARLHGAVLLFNTGRQRGEGRLLLARRQLTAAGYRVTEVCGRRAGEGLAAGKQRCRRHFRGEGFTLVANVGNRSTDFEGGGYERAFRLPSYGNRLS